MNAMAICKNPDCPRSYMSADGKIVVNLVKQLRQAHNAGKALAAQLIRRLKKLAPRIYQAGAPPCAGCEQVNLAHQTGSGEPPEVNILLENIELLELNGVPI